MPDNNPDGTGSNKRASKRRSIAIIAAVLAIDYATILRIEIFSEVENGESFLEAVTQGNLYLTAIGILISVVGVALIIYLLAGQKRDRGGA